MDFFFSFDKIISSCLALLFVFILTIGRQIKRVALFYPMNGSKNDLALLEIFIDQFIESFKAS
jgi:hypothetical protein